MRAKNAIAETYDKEWKSILSLNQFHEPYPSIVECANL